MDFREDKNCDTGQFEMVYKQKMPNCQPYLGTALSVQGTKITSNDKKLCLDPKTVPKLSLVIELKNHNNFLQLLNIIYQV